MTTDEEWTALDARLRTMLPAEYQETYETLEPTPMRSAPLKLDPDGQVAWNEMWGSFCDLAMAGGPPHKGALLGPPTPAAMAAEPERYEEVRQEVCRGIRVVTSLETAPSPVSGWVRMTCLGEGMAGWLLRAITMENVAVRAEGRLLDLPAGPAFRVEKEIRNVVTVASKTCHYWMEHIPFSQQRVIAALVATMNAEAPLVEAREAGWRGVPCPSVRAAVWMMRALVASNVLARREGTTLYVPADEAHARRVTDALERVRRLALARGVC